MSERFEHRDGEHGGAYEYTLKREFARRRARGCATITVGIIVGIIIFIMFITCAMIGSGRI